MDKPRILIVDDEPGVRESLRILLKERAQPIVAETGEAAIRKVAEERTDIVLLDIIMPGIDGLETLERIKEHSSAPQVIMLTATKTVKTAVRAMKLGAFDYVTKPFDVDELLLIIDRAMDAAALQREVASLRMEVGTRYGLGNIIAASASMQEALKTAKLVARLKSTVLITGESGTGKEVVAKAIHYNSPRADRPMVAVNCAAIPDTLLESELFGHERGAFTDAHSRKIGLFEEAHRGTVFLDEIGEMNPGTQAKLLRVLEQGTLTRVGGSHPIHVDVRVVAATNKDIQQGMQDGTFRPDLYFRLNVVAIHLAPVRERTEDIPLLIQHFLRCKARELDLPEKRFSSDATAILLRYSWPGNVREIENVVERALALSQKDVLGPEDLPGNVTAGPNGTALPQICSARDAAEIRTLTDAVADLEHRMILEALDHTDQNQTQAAQLLGTTRRILKYKMDKLGIAEAPCG